MKYDSKGINEEIVSLKNHKETVYQNYMKVLGAIEMLESMHKIAGADEQQEEIKRAEEEKEKNPERLACGNQKEDGDDEYIEHS